MHPFFSHFAKFHSLQRPASWALAGVALLALARALGAWEPFREGIFVPWVGPVVSVVLNTLTGRAVGASLAEWILLLSVTTLAAAAWRGWRQPGRAAEKLARGLLWGAAGAAWLAAGGTWAWGIYYQRAPLGERLAWPPSPTPGAPGERAHLEALAAALTVQTNLARLALPAGGYGREAAALALRVDAAVQARVSAAVEISYMRLQAKLGLEPAFAWARGPAKPVFFTTPMSYAKIGGIYIPFTGEANVNTAPPPVGYPYVVGHEKAHQRGIASEDEANFMGFLACVESDDPYTRYAGWFFAHRQLLQELQRRDPPAAALWIRARLPGVHADVLATRDYWARYEGWMAQTSAAINDSYLKSQGVKGGITAYNRSSELILRYYAALALQVEANPGVERP